jgi:hypothetical protein
MIDIELNDFNGHDIKLLANLTTLTTLTNVFFNSDGVTPKFTVT